MNPDSFKDGKSIYFTIDRLEITYLFKFIMIICIQTHINQSIVSINKQT
jgi:hypothetical protein